MASRLSLRILRWGDKKSGKKMGQVHRSWWKKINEKVHQTFVMHTYLFNYWITHVEMWKIYSDPSVKVIINKFGISEKIVNRNNVMTIGPWNILIGEGLKCSRTLHLSTKYFKTNPWRSLQYILNWLCRGKPTLSYIYFNLLTLTKLLPSLTWSL